ncbi:MAG TPA: N4-gp56 family major capsid protein [Caulobacteraceae bacterium]|nr:N4-gp56 family major capsid protein [Caulobacteraceae bacterium]
MAQTSYGVNAPEAVKLWRKTLFEEALKATWVGKFIGETSDSILQILPDTGKSAGDTVTTTLRMQLQSDGVIGDATLEGNDEALITYTDKLLINQQRNAVRSGGKMSDQRIPWSVREEAQTGLSDWFASRFDYGFFNQVAGNTAQTSIAYTGLNAPIAPDSAHKYVPNGHVADQNLTTGDEFNLSFIDNAVALAKLATPVIRPVMVDGEAMYVAVLHTNQVTQLRTNTATGQWLDIQKAATTGDGSKNNPIFTGALGVYNGVVLHESTRVPAGVNSTSNVAVSNTRRGVLLGAQSAVIGFGQGQSMDAMDWTEELFDYGNQLGVAAACIYGLKKSQYNSADYGTVVLASYTA